MKQDDLADASGVSVPTIKWLEAMRDPVNANFKTVRAIRHALAVRGITFIGDGASSGSGGVCVRLTQAGVAPV